MIKRIWTFSTGIFLLYALFFGANSNYISNAIASKSTMEGGALKYGNLNGNIYQMEMDGSNCQLLSDLIVSNLIYHDGNLYFISFEDFAIGKININTNEREEIISGAYFNFNIKDNLLICSNSETIDVFQFDGELIKSYKPEKSPRDTSINLADDYVFYRRFGTNEISMLDLHTLNTEIIIKDKFN